MSKPAGSRRNESTADASTDRAAEFAAHFRESFRVLWLIAMGFVRDRTEAEDVVQEAAVIALRKLHQFHPGSNFTAWMGQIVRNVARNQRRARHKRRVISLERSAGRTAGSSEHSDHSIDRGEHPAAADASVPSTRSGSDHRLDDRVMAALWSVSDVARACLLLRTIENLPYARIAELLEIPEGTAMSHVHRARAFLRERLSGRGSDSPESEGGL